MANTQRSLNEIQMENLVYQEQLDCGLSTVDKVKKRNAFLQKQIKEELIFQSELQRKISFLKTERSRFDKEVSKSNYRLAQVQRYSKELKSQSEKGLKKSYNLNKVVRNNPAALISSVTRGTKNRQEKSILLSCVQELIETTLDNEFSAVSWMARTSERSNNIASRIRFTNLSTRPNDLHDIYLPVIQKMKLAFRYSGLVIRTKTKKVNGIINQVEFTICIPYKDKSFRPELP